MSAPNMQPLIQSIDELVQVLRGSVPALQAVRTEGTSLADQFKNLVGGMAASGSAVQDMGLQAAKLVPGLGEVVMAAQVAASTVQQFTDTVKKYVSAYSPADVAFFDMAIKDLTAVIGYELQPAMQGMTQIVREIADSLFADGAQVRAAIKDATDAVVKAFKDNKATVDFLTTSFSELIKQTARLVELFAKLNSLAPSGILMLLAEGNKDRNAFALAAGSGNVTSPDQAFMTAQRSALAMGGGAETPEDKRHKELMGQLKSWDKFAGIIGAAGTFVLDHISGSIIDTKQEGNAASRIGRILKAAFMGGLLR